MTSPGVVPGCSSGGCAAAGVLVAVTCFGVARCGDDGGELGACEAPKSGSTALLDLAHASRGNEELVGAVGVGLSGRRALLSLAVAESFFRGRLPLLPLRTPDFFGGLAPPADETLGFSAAGKEGTSGEGRDPAFRLRPMLLCSGEWRREAVSGAQ